MLLLLASVAPLGPAATAGVTTAADSIGTGGVAQLDVPSLGANPRVVVDRAEQTDGARDLWVASFLTVAGVVAAAFGFWLASSDRTPARLAAGPFRVARPRGPPAVLFV